MAATPLTHVIGIAILISLLLVSSNYVVLMQQQVAINNARTVLGEVAEAISAYINRMLGSGQNGSLVVLNLPLEVYSGMGYNVYIGLGGDLAPLFPAIGDVIARDPNAVSYVFVVASLPDRSVYEYRLAVNTTGLRLARPQYAEVLVGEGNFTKVFGSEGYPYTEAYYEDGYLWLCRVRINITENANYADLYDYAINITFDPSALSCSWKGRTFKPTYDDVRFASSDLSPLNYYVEEWSNTSARVWVKVPHIPKGGSTYIYMYWGTLGKVSYRGDPRAVFAYFANFTEMDEYLFRSEWLERSNNTVSKGYSLSDRLVVWATYTSSGKLWTTSYYNIYSSRTYNVSAGGPGIIVEAYGGPLTANDQDYRLGLYDEASKTRPLLLIIQPALVDPIDERTLVNLTRIWGNYSLVDFNNETALAIHATENASVIGYRGLSALPHPWYIIQPPGKEDAQLLVRVYPWNVSPLGIFGVLMFGNGTLGTNKKGFGIGLKAVELPGNKWGISFCTYNDQLRNLPDNPSYWSCSTPVIVNSLEWLYIYLKARAPGASLTDLDYYIYLESKPFEPLFSGSIKGLGGLYIDTIGFLVTDPDPLYYNATAFFDMLLAGRYNRNEEFPDYRYINITGLAPGTYVEIWDLGPDGEYYLVGSNETTSDGWAYIPLMSRPILGTFGSSLIIVYSNSSKDEVLFTIEYVPQEDPETGKTIYLTGGSVVVIDIGVGSITDYKALELRASRYINGTTNLRGLYWTYLYSRSPASASSDTSHIAWYNTYIEASAGVTNYTAVGIFNATAYYFVGDAANKRVFTITGANETGSWRAVIGVADGSTTSNTSAAYTWIRLRPFVYPEPSASLGSAEHMREDYPPQVTYSIKSPVLFSSSIIADIALVIKGIGDNEYRVIIVVIKRGVRGP